MKIEDRLPKVGEKILVINPREGVTKYKKHDVLTVTATKQTMSNELKKYASSGDVSVSVLIKEEANPHAVIARSEYLVYTPTVYKPRVTTYTYPKTNSSGYRMPTKGVGATDKKSTGTSLSKQEIKEKNKAKESDQKIENFWKEIGEEEESAKRLQLEEARAVVGADKKETPVAQDDESLKKELIYRLEELGIYLGENTAGSQTLKIFDKIKNNAYYMFLDSLPKSFGDNRMDKSNKVWDLLREICDGKVE